MCYGDIVDQYYATSDDKSHSIDARDILVFVVVFVFFAIKLNNRFS